MVLPVEGSCPWRVRKDTLNTPVKQEASVVARILGLQAEENVKNKHGKDFVKLYETESLAESA